jgi:hypothetical protein
MARRPGRQLMRTHGKKESEICIFMENCRTWSSWFVLFLTALRLSRLLKLDNVIPALDVAGAAKHHPCQSAVRFLEACCRSGPLRRTASRRAAFPKTRPVRAFARLAAAPLRRMLAFSLRHVAPPFVSQAGPSIVSSPPQRAEHSKEAARTICEGWQTAQPATPITNTCERVGRRTEKRILRLLRRPGDLAPLRAR